VHARAFGDGGDGERVHAEGVEHVLGRLEHRAADAGGASAGSSLDVRAVMPVEITGPSAARIRPASSTTDADVFVTLRVQDPDGGEVSLVSAIDANGVLGVGWLRASHRETDPERSLPYRPWRPHRRLLPLTPGEVVDLDVEVWPTSIVVPTGYRFGITVSGRDFEMPGDGPWPMVYGIPQRGNGVFVHDDPDDRPAGVFDGTTTLFTGPAAGSSILLPGVP
jgi:predicted acyl esterase